MKDDTTAKTMAIIGITFPLLLLSKSPEEMVYNYVEIGLFVPSLATTILLMMRKDPRN